MRKNSPKSLRILIAIFYLLTIGIGPLPEAEAAPWAGFTDQTSSSNSNIFSFTQCCGFNENYYDGDFADYDGDGRVDRLLISRWGLLQNNGNLQFTPMGAQPGIGQPARPNPTGFSFRDDGNRSSHGISGDDAAQWADLDNDGDYDALMGGNGESFSIQRNDNGQFTRIFNVSGNSALNIVNTDVENDGDVDFFTAHSFGVGPNQSILDFDLWINNGNNQFTRTLSDANLISLGFAINGVSINRLEVTDIASGDVDGDGDFDLIASIGEPYRNGGAGMWVFKNNGSGIYTPSGIPNSHPSPSGFVQGMNLGDIDDDGDLDLVAATLDSPHPQTEHSIYINNGNGQFTNESATRFSIASGAEVHYINNKVGGGNAKLMDVDYDGDLDFVGIYTINDDKVNPPRSYPQAWVGKRLYIYVNDGSGFFSLSALGTNTHFKINTPTEFFGRDMDVTDLDGDGVYDLWLGLAGEDVRMLINSYTDPSGIPADQPRNLQLVSSNSNGNTIKWQAPPFAATARYYKVYRSQQPGLPLAQRQLIHRIGHRHQDEGFSAPITRHTLTAYLGDPDVTLNGASNEIQFIDRSAVQGGLYYYSVVHVGTENTNSGPTPEVSTNGAPQNQPPTADAGQDQTVDEGVQVQLQGSGTDQDGDPITYSWTKLVGPAVTFDASAQNPTFVAPQVNSNTTMTFQLIVTDDKNASSQPDTVDVTINDLQTPQPPTCSLNSFNPGLINATLPFDVGSVAGTNPINYSWNFGDGSPATTPSSNSQASHSFATLGRYGITLTVSNSVGNSICTMTQIVHNTLTPNQPNSSNSIITNGTRIFNVNPDNDSVTAIDQASQSKVWEQTVGKNPTTLAEAPNGNIWVVNQDDASISILDANLGTVLNTISLPYASRPYGVVFAPNGQRVFVSLQGTGRVIKLSSTGSILENILVGPQTRGLAISGDSTRLYVTRFISNGSEGDIWELSTNPLSLTRTIKLGFDPGPDSPFGSQGVPNYVNSIRISPDGTTALVASKKDNIAKGQFRDGTNLNFETRVRTIISHIDLTTGQEILNKRLDIDDQAMAQSVLYSPVGDLFFAGLLASNRIEVFDSNTHQNLSGEDTGIGNQGMAFNSDGSRLYAHNFLSRSISIFDTNNLISGVNEQFTLLTEVSTVSNEKLDPTVLKGKQIFYNAADDRMSKENYISCASCHLDGGSDGQIWDFTQGGEGLRNTITLRGRGGTNHGNVHWTANFDEIHDFENDIRNNFGGTGFLSDADFNNTQDPLGNPKAGLNADLDALVAYVESLRSTPASPYRNSDGTLTPDAEAGKLIFMAQNCQTCHAPPLFTDKKRHDVGTIQPSSGQGIGQPLAGIGFETPTLIGIWNTAPYLHNGQAATLADVISNPLHTDTSTLTSNQKIQLIAYLNQLDDNEKISFNEPPVVNAGEDQTVQGNTWPLRITLSGSVTDDGPVDAISLKWIQLTGPDEARFGNDTDLNTEVEFRASGTYQLVLRADDGIEIATDEITIQVFGSGQSSFGDERFNPIINPAQGHTEMNIAYSMLQDGEAKLLIYDRRGKLIRQLLHGIKGMGTHSITWDGKGDDGSKVASGSYILYMKLAGQVRKLWLAVLN